MAVVQVVAQHVDHARPHPVDGIRAVGHGLRDHIRPLKPHMDLFAAKDIGVLMNAVNGGGTEFPKGREAFRRRHADGFQSDHHLAHGKLFFEFLADFMRLFPGDTLDGGEALRLVFQDIEGAVAKGLHDFSAVAARMPLTAPEERYFKSCPAVEGRLRSHSSARNWRPKEA